MSLSRLQAPIVALILAVVAPSSATAAGPPLVLVLDASGSMWGQVGGTAKIAIARQVLDDLVDGMADDAVVGLVAYGHRRESDCADVETLIAPGPLDRAAIKAAVGRLQPKGKTPITGAIEQAFASLGTRPGPATVVLVSDGLETCGGDPCAAVKAARARNAELVFHVVGFGVAEEDVSQLECAAQAGGGVYLAAADAAALAKALAVTTGARVDERLDFPTGELHIGVTSNGVLSDATYQVFPAGGKKSVASGRTYQRSTHNPAKVRLAAGIYDVEVASVVIAGRPTRRFEKVEVDPAKPLELFHELPSGVLRVGAVSGAARVDAVVRVVDLATGKGVDQGRTYVAATTNPKPFILSPGSYRIELAAVRLPGKPTRIVERVEVAAGATVVETVDFGG